VALVLLIAANCASGFEKIEAAFGMKLGSEFDPASATKADRLTDGKVFYGFTPTNGFPPFVTYRVLITPVSKKIYQIMAKSESHNVGAVEREQNAITYILTEKYGPLSDSASSDPTEKSIVQNHRGVRTHIMDRTTLAIEYYDMDLFALAKKEQAAEDVKDKDKSGL
jgi:hypothetical protein